MYVRSDGLPNCYDFFEYIEFYKLGNIRFDVESGEESSEVQSEEVSEDDTTEQVSTPSDSDGIINSINNINHVVSFWFLLWCVITCKRILHKSVMKNTDEV